MTAATTEWLVELRADHTFQNKNQSTSQGRHPTTSLRHEELDSTRTRHDPLLLSEEAKRYWEARPSHESPSGYQSDALSLLLLSKGLTPVSQIITKNHNGYRFRSGVTVGQHLYTDDIKLYLRNERDTHWSASPGSTARTSGCHLDWISEAAWWQREGRWSVLKGWSYQRAG